jgi:hypothetical protein
MPASLTWAVHGAVSGASSPRNYSLFIMPTLVIYRKCYGDKLMLIILASLCATKAAAGYLIEPDAGWFPRADRSR